MVVFLSFVTRCVERALEKFIGISRSVVMGAPFGEEILLAFLCLSTTKLPVTCARAPLKSFILLVFGGFFRQPFFRLAPQCPKPFFVGKTTLCRQGGRRDFFPFCRDCAGSCLRGMETNGRETMPTEWKKPDECPACGEARPQKRGAWEAPPEYLRCAICGSLYAPAFLKEPLIREEWEGIFRPCSRPGDAQRLLQPLGGFAKIALAGRADPDLLRALLRRGLPAQACDLNASVVSEAVKASLPVRLGSPASGALDESHDLILIEGLLEYAPDPLRELIAVRERLYRDGRARIEAPSSNNPLLRRQGHAFPLFRSPPVRTLFSVDGLTRIAARAGFRSVHIVHKPARAADAFIAQGASNAIESAWYRLLERMTDSPTFLAATARVE
jgi:hypothetical protein